MEESKGLEASLSKETQISFFTQGLEEMASEYTEQVKFRKEHGFGYDNHWRTIPEKIKIGNTEYNHQELIQHFKNQDEVGTQIFDKMWGYFSKSRLAVISVLAFLGQVEKGKSHIKLIGGNRVITANEVLEMAKSPDLKVNMTMSMAVYEAVKSLYMEPSRENGFVM